MPPSSDSALPLPDYLREVYEWAYLTPWLADLLDRQLVVQTILWGNAQKLIDDTLAEITRGQKIFQPAAVYGDFSRQLARKIGPEGRLEIRDIAPLQVNLTRRKLADLPQAHIAWGDAAKPAGQQAFDAVTCFFLLHEVPDEVKSRVADAMLSLVRPGGKAIFVDYHRPAPWHPLKPLMAKIFEHLEPFAPGIWERAIEDWAGDRAKEFTWRKRTRFGGLYQVTVAERI
jgi:ubiquinone/menaquinone biosynthesis C-methylase UbiE